MRLTVPSTRIVALTLLAAAAALTASSASRAAEPLRWKLHSGDKFDYAIVQDMTMNVSGVPAGGSTTTMHQQLDMQWEVKEVKADGDAIIGQTIKRVRMKMTGGNGEGFEYDSDNQQPATGMAAMFAPMYEAMMQGQIDVTMTARGEVTDVKIPDQLVTALKSVPGAANMGDAATAEGFKKMFTQGAMTLPETAPTEGEKWSSDIAMAAPMMGKITVETTYLYKGTKQVDGATCAVIEPSLTTTFGGQTQVPMTVKDQSSGGQILFNEDAGRLQSSLIKQNMTLSAALGDRTIEQTIQQTTNVTLTPAAE